MGKIEKENGTCHVTREQGSVTVLCPITRANGRRSPRTSTTNANVTGVLLSNTWIQILSSVLTVTATRRAQGTSSVTCTLAIANVTLRSLASSAIPVAVNGEYGFMGIAT